MGIHGSVPIQARNGSNHNGEHVHVHMCIVKLWPGSSLPWQIYFLSWACLQCVSYFFLIITLRQLVGNICIFTFLPDPVLFLLLMLWADICLSSVLAPVDTLSSVLTWCPLVPSVIFSFSHSPSCRHLVGCVTCFSPFLSTCSCLCRWQCHQIADLQSVIVRQWTV